MSSATLSPTHAERVLWDALWQRHTASLSFQEIRRGLCALSATYVQKRQRLGGQAQMGRGKKAAFALCYAPRHLLVTKHILASFAAERLLNLAVPKLYDLGCGTGVGGAAWARAARQAGIEAPHLVGVDTDPWALEEARWLYRTLGLRGRTSKQSLVDVEPRAPGAIVAAYAINELDEAARAALWRKLRALWTRGMPVLIIEPVARGIAPYLPAWAAEAHPLGARIDEWRLRVTLSEQLELLSRAAKLDHRELTARSLFLPPRPGSLES